MKRHLPVLTEVAVREAEIQRHQRATTFEQQLLVEAGKTHNQLSCDKGCHNCCYYPVAVSPLEGITLYRWLHDNGHWKRSFKAKLEETHDRVWGLSPSVWLLGMIPCPLLTPEGTCQAHDARPFACRTTFSTQDPELCHPHRFGEASGMVPRKEVAGEYEKVEDQLLKSVHLPPVRLPLASAVLLGEMICTEDLSSDDVMRRLLSKRSG